jgi:hypothetical protein
MLQLRAVIDQDEYMRRIGDKPHYRSEFRERASFIVVYGKANKERRDGRS